MICPCYQCHHGTPTTDAIRLGIGRKTALPLVTPPTTTRSLLLAYRPAEPRSSPSRKPATRHKVRDKSGQFVECFSSEADFVKAIVAGETKVHVPAEGSIPKELQCALAEGFLIVDAVILPCCQTNVSHKAVLPRLQDSFSCPICMQPDVTPDMLLNNKKLRDSVCIFIRTAKEKGIKIKGIAPTVPAQTK